VIWLWVVVAVLVILGSILAVAEASLTRMTRVRALALVEEGRRNAVTLERIEADPPRFLNAVYLTSPNVPTVVSASRSSRWSSRCCTS
jgi:CBS domain containing-hemolysin-like protein